MGGAMDDWTIGTLAQFCDVSRDTLRYYEREGLLPRPRRSQSGYRLYRPDDAFRVRFVRRAQTMGLTLADVRQLLRVSTRGKPEQCTRVAACIEARVVAVSTKIRELEAFRDELLTALKRCESAMSRDERCPVVLDLSRKAAERA